MDDFFGEDWLEGVGDDGVGKSVLVDEQLLEDGLVEATASVRVAELVGLGRVLAEVEHHVEGSQEFSALAAVALEHPAGVLDVAVDGCLLGLELLERECFVEVGVEEALVLAFESCQALGGLTSLFLGVLALLVGEVADVVDDVSGELFGHRHARVEAFESFLDGFGGDEAEAAAGVPASGTREVVVELPGLGAVAGEAEAGAAAGAVQAAGQVVVVSAELLAGEVAFVEDGLDGLEGPRVDERFVLARVLNALEGDDPDVVAVAEHLGDLAAMHRTTGTLLGGQGAHASCIKGFGQLGERRVVLGEGAERPSDVVGPFWVDDDGGGVVAGAVVDDVEVAERRFAGRAAELGLLEHALGGFGAEVVGVVLVERPEHTDEHAPAGAVVDVFGTRNQLSAMVADGGHEAELVDELAAEPIQLVDDDVVDVTLLADALHHGLERRPVSELGALASVQVLIDDVGVEVLVGFAAAGFTLGRQRVTLDLAALAGLLLGRDAYVDDGSFASVLAERCLHLLGGG